MVVLDHWLRVRVLLHLSISAHYVWISLILFTIFVEKKKNTKQFYPTALGVCCIILLLFILHNMVHRVFPNLRWFHLS